MVYLRRQDKAREMELVRGLSWGSSANEGRRFDSAPCVPPNTATAMVGGGGLQSPSEDLSGLPFNGHVPPAGFEPALPADADCDSDSAVAGGEALPSVLLAKVAALRDMGNERVRR
jgi:hypothetical protein